MKYEQLEEGIHEQDTIWFDTAGIQEDGHWRSVESVAIEDGLDHDQRLGQVLSH